MKQVIQNTRNGELALCDVPAPGVEAGSVLVRTRASLISAGTERMVVDFARKNLAAKARARPDLVRKVLDKARKDGLGATMRAVLARLDEPLPLGYSAAGEVVAVGERLEGAFQVGQRVAVAGAGLANHAEINAVPRNLVAPIPDDVPFENACFSTLGAIAMHGVRNLGPQLGDVVAVLGVGLLGQIATQLLSLSGVRVVALDYDPSRLELAKTMGAERALNLSDAGLEQAVMAMTQGLGCDGVLIAAATESSEPFQTAAALARDRARVVLVGMTGTELPYREFMQKELSVVVSRSYGPGRYDNAFEGRGVRYPEGWVRWTETANLAECARLMSPSPPRFLDVGALITHRFDFDDAEKAYELVTGGAEPHLGVVLNYAGEPRAAPAFPAPKAAAGKCVLGVLGAGNFARTVLLPELKKNRDVTLHTVVTRRGPSADKTRQAFDFAQADTDVETALSNPDVNAVLIATRHDSHAELTARALEAGKSVLVEKPLALDRAQLNQVIEARNGSAGFFQVGFNRRFAPLVVQARDRLEKTAGPRHVLLRVNAGAIPAESWIQDAGEGGGRVLGEACHFIDLARFLVGAPIITVRAVAARIETGDDVAITLAFSDGSLGTVAYTALGDTALAKERIEAYAGGIALVIDDYQSLEIAEGGRVKRTKVVGARDKGFAGSLKAFAAAVSSGGPAPIDEAELAETALATIAAMESLRSGESVDI